MDPGLGEGEERKGREREVRGCKSCTGEMESDRAHIPAGADVGVCGTPVCAARHSRRDGLERDRQKETCKEQEWVCCWFSPVEKGTG